LKLPASEPERKTTTPANPINPYCPLLWAGNPFLTRTL